MSGKAKIEGLTNAWYGFAVFSALFSVFTNGIGFFSIGGAAIGMIFSWIITFFIGRALIRKSSFTRTILLLLSGIFSVVGAIGIGKSTWVFVQTWQFSLLVAIGYALVSLYMNARSFRTLTDSSVKSYFS